MASAAFDASAGAGGFVVLSELGFGASASLAATIKIRNVELANAHNIECPSVDFTLLDAIPESRQSGLADVTKHVWADALVLVLPAGSSRPPRVRAAVWGDGMECREEMAAADVRLSSEAAALISVRLHGEQSVQLAFAYEVCAQCAGDEALWPAVWAALPAGAAERGRLGRPEFVAWLQRAEATLSPDGLATFVSALTVALPRAAYRDEAAEEHGRSQWAHQLAAAAIGDARALDAVAGRRVHAARAHAGLHDSG